MRRMSEIHAAPAAPPRARATALRAAAALAALAALVVAGRQAGGAVERFAAFVEGLGAFGPIVYVVGYALATVAFVPGSVLTLAGGAIFGLGRGFVLVFAAAVLGSSAAFLVARHVARRRIERRILAHPRFAAIDRAVAEQGRWIVFLLRLSPVFPFVFLNYALGLTRVRFADTLVASVGMIPGTLLYVYYGALAGEVAKLAAGGGVAAERGAGYWAVLGLGLAATLAVTTVVTRAARRALRESGPLEEVSRG
jgi:uncharacterized membrane protein YdjX (TVP38/TMEM64 family)